MSKVERISNVYLPCLGFVGCIRFSRVTNIYFYEPKSECAVMCRNTTLEDCVKDVVNMFPNCSII